MKKAENISPTFRCSVTRGAAVSSGSSGRKRRISHEDNECFYEGNPLTIWRKRYQENSLTEESFREYWQYHVPDVYHVGKDNKFVEFGKANGKLEKVLLEPLEAFMCDTEPRVVLQELSNKDKPSFCGRELNSGAPSYFCRECATDPTCVLCVECFRESEHKNHRYQINTSSGGGYCDCGDVEAWKSDVYCKIHAPVKSDNDNDNPVDRLQRDFVERLRLVFGVLLKYVVELTSKKVIGKESDLISSDHTNLYVVMLTKDGALDHDFILLLTNILKVSISVGEKHCQSLKSSGRTFVSCSTLKECEKLKSEIEKHNFPASVHVVPADVISHQQFALDLLKWFEKITSLTQGIRVVFFQSARTTCVSNRCSVLERIMSDGSNILKTAHKLWNNILGSSVHLHIDEKKEFAKCFLKSYVDMYNDYMKDSIDENDPVFRLSVQIFTIPSIAHALISEESALALILRAVCSECRLNSDRNNKLSFTQAARRHVNFMFQRVHSGLCDASYLLVSPPDVWTEGIRTGFLSGFQQLIDFLMYIQGVDRVKRYISQHIEYEPPLHYAFDIQSYYADLLERVLLWCASDKEVLVRAYRMVLETIVRITQQLHLESHTCLIENNGHHAEVILYDISKGVSMHFPLHRLLASLHIYLDKFSINVELENSISISWLKEPVLRHQLQLAEIQAGLWKRNGFSLVYQVRLYQNVGYWKEMMDRDILLLQICASLQDPDEFLLQLLHKFDMQPWPVIFTAQNKRTIEEMHILLDEVLRLLIMIVGERCLPGLGDVSEPESLRYHIIQNLCAGPLSHSDLCKKLCDDPDKIGEIEHIACEVAKFNKPTIPTKKAQYVLKDENLLKCNNFYFHNSREEQSKSEETVIKYRKSNLSSACCPPPQLPPLTNSFRKLVNLLNCDTMFDTMKTILSNFLEDIKVSTSQGESSERKGIVTEGHVQKVLYLIGYGLQEESRIQNPTFNFTAQLQKRGVVSILSELTSHDDSNVQKDFFQWIMSKYRQMTETEGAEGCSSTEQHASSRSGPVKSRMEIAAAQRARIMAQMSSMQKNFLKDNPELFKMADLESGDDSSMEFSSCFQGAFVCLGSNRTSYSPEVERHTCILCQETQLLTFNDKALVIPAYMQVSTVLNKQRSEIHSLHGSTDLDINLSVGIHASSCGHVLHSDCWDRYFADLREKQNRRRRFNEHGHQFDVNQGEFVCPLCNRLSNTVITMVATLSSVDSQMTSDAPFEVWLQGMEAMAAIDRSTLAAELNQKSISDIFEQYGMRSSEQFAAMYPRPDTVKVPFSESILSYSRKYYLSVLRITDSLPVMWNIEPEINYFTPLIFLIQSVPYTVHVAEWLARTNQQSLFEESYKRQLTVLSQHIQLIVALVNSSESVEKNALGIHGIKLLQMLLKPTPSQCIVLSSDMFSIVTALVFTQRSFLNSQTPLSISGVSEQHILRLAFFGHLLQVMLNTEVVEEKEDVTDGICPDGVFISELYSLLYTSAGCEELRQNFSWNSFVLHAKDAMLPFLRMCTVFFHALSGVPLSEELLTSGIHNYNGLCRYLGISHNLSEIMDNKTAKTLMERWCCTESLQLYLREKNTASSGTQSALPLFPLRVNELVELPVDYSDLIYKTSNFSCSRHKSDYWFPAMCLICGEIVCRKKQCTIEAGMEPVVAHSKKCGAGIGMFLYIKECSVLLVKGDIVGSGPLAPYVDKYGETDMNLNRGNPLHLCKERYLQLHKLWLEHKIPDQVSQYAANQHAQVQFNLEALFFQ